MPRDFAQYFVAGLGSIPGQTKHHVFYYGLNIFLWTLFRNV